MVNSDCVSKYQFFGLPLNRLYANGILNPILWAILHGLYLNGLETEGIFRKCASAKVLRELKEKIERVGIVIYSELVETPPLLLSALLKEFLRNLPLPLLTGPSIQEWLHVDVNRTVHYLHSLLMKLPHDNYNLLSVIICLLFHIARRSNYNLMSAANLSKFKFKIAILPIFDVSNSDKKCFRTDLDNTDSQNETFCGYNFPK